MKKRFIIGTGLLTAGHPQKVNHCVIKMLATEERFTEDQWLIWRKSKGSEASEVKAVAKSYHCSKSKKHAHSKKSVLGARSKISNIENRVCTLGDVPSHFNGIAPQMIWCFTLQTFIRHEWTSIKDSLETLRPWELEEGFKVLVNLEFWA